MTIFERKVWQRLRDGQTGVSFRRQHPVGSYFADFAAPSIGLIVEIDGDQHGYDEGRQSDAIRSGFLAGKGYQVIRFWNHEIAEDLDSVIETIWHQVRLGGEGGSGENGQSI